MRSLIFSRPKWSSCRIVSARLRSRLSLRLLVPRHRDEPVEVVARDGGFGRHRRHRLEPLQLVDRLPLDVLRHPRLFDLLLQVVDLVALLVLAAQLALDRLHLLVEVVLLLRLLHLLLHARLDAAVDLELVHLGFEHGDDARRAARRARRSRAGSASPRRPPAGAPAIVSARRDGSSTRTAAIIASYCRLFESLMYCSKSVTTRLMTPSASAAGLGLLRDQLHRDPVEALVFLPLHGAGALDALDEHLDVAVGQLQRLHDVGHAAHRVDVGRLRIVDRRVVLRGEEDLLVGRERMLERARRRRPSDDERHHHVREDDDVPQRDDGERFVLIHGDYDYRVIE